MATVFRVVDLRGEAPLELTVERVRSPEEAARLAIGETLVRSGQTRDLRARVYTCRPGEMTSMVRLYRRVGDRS